MKRTGMMLIVLTLLASIACAQAEGGITAYLMPPEATPSEAFLASIQTIDTVDEADNIRIAVTEAMSDGELLAVSWTIENLAPDAPAVVEIERVRVNGDTVFVWTDSLTGQWQPRMFSLGATGERTAPKQGGMVTYLRDGRVSGPLEVELSLVISRPVGPLVIVDADLYEADRYDAEDFAAMQAEIEASGIQVAGPDALEAEAWAEQGYTVIDSSGGFPVASNVEYSQTRTYWLQENQMAQSGTIDLAFTVQADVQAAAPVDYAPEGTYAYGENAFTAQQLTISPLSTIMAFEIAMAEQGTVDAMHLSQPGIAFFDADGHRIDYLRIDYMAGWMVGETPEGKEMLVFGEAMPGLVATPASLVIGDFDHWTEASLQELEETTETLLVIPLVTKEITP